MVRAHSAAKAPTASSLVSLRCPSVPISLIPTPANPTIRSISGPASEPDPGATAGSARHPVPRTDEPIEQGLDLRLGPHGHRGRRAGVQLLVSRGQFGLPFGTRVRDDEHAARHQGVTQPSDDAAGVVGVGNEMQQGDEQNGDRTVEI